MQYDLTNARLWFRDNLPSTRPSSFYSLRDLMILDNGDTYVWNNGWEKVTNPILTSSGGTAGTNGKDATVTIGSVTVTTLAPGSQATASVTDTNPDPNVATLNFAFGIPQGERGQDGTSGTGSVGAMPFIYVHGTGNVTTDTANLNAAIAENRTTRKPIYLSGNIMAGDIIIPKDSYRLTIIGYGAKWTIPSTAQTAMKRVAPVDNGDANVQIIATHRISGIEFQGTNTQVALDLGPSYMSVYRDLRFTDCYTAMHLRFSLRTAVEDCQAVSCVMPWIADMGNWAGATNSNSQSNCTTFNRCQNYMPQNGLDAFSIIASSGCVIRDSIIEGYVVRNGINFDAKGATVVKDFTVENIHFECINGATNAFLKTSILGGTVTVNKVFGQYPSLFMDATSGSGLGFISVANVPWWIGKNGKFFKTSNISMHFDRNEAFVTLKPEMWEGTAPQACMPVGTNGCGYHRYSFVNIPR